MCSARNVLQNYLAPNLSFLAGAEQLICRTPPLAASGKICNLII